VNSVLILAASSAAAEGLTSNPLTENQVDMTSWSPGDRLSPVSVLLVGVCSFASTPFPLTTSSSTTPLTALELELETGKGQDRSGGIDTVSVVYVYGIDIL
jgi:hypothetical protein